MQATKLSSQARTPSRCDAPYHWAGIRITVFWLEVAVFVGAWVSEWTRRTTAIDRMSCPWVTRRGDACAQVMTPSKGSTWIASVRPGQMRYTWRLTASRRFWLGVAAAVGHGVGGGPNVGRRGRLAWAPAVW